MLSTVFCTILYKVSPWTHFHATELFRGVLQVGDVLSNQMASSPLSFNVACLQCVSLSRLQSCESSEISRLPKAYQTHRFFYLHLEVRELETALQDYEHRFQAYREPHERHSDYHHRRNG